MAYQQHAGAWMQQLEEWACTAWPKSEPGAALRRQAVTMLAHRPSGPVGPHTMWFSGAIQELQRSAAFKVIFRDAGPNWTPAGLAQAVAGQLHRAGNCFRFLSLQGQSVVALDVPALCRASTFWQQQPDRPWPALAAPPVAAATSMPPPTAPAPAPSAGSSGGGARGPKTLARAVPRAGVAAAIATITRAQQQPSRCGRRSASDSCQSGDALADNGAGEPTAAPAANDCGGLPLSSLAAELSPRQRQRQLQPGTPLFSPDSNGPAKGEGGVFAMARPAVGAGGVSPQRAGMAVAPWLGNHDNGQSHEGWGADGSCHEGSSGSFSAPAGHTDGGVERHASGGVGLAEGDDGGGATAAHASDGAGGNARHGDPGGCANSSGGGAAHVPGSTEAPPAAEDAGVLGVLQILEAPAMRPPTAAAAAAGPLQLWQLVDREDEGTHVALSALCLCAWWPAKPWLAAAALAIVNPPAFLSGSASKPGLSKLNFFLREAARFLRQTRCAGPRDVAAALRHEPLAKLLDGGSGSGGLSVVLLDLRRAARLVLVAAGVVAPVAGAREVEAVAAAGVSWPPSGLAQLTVQAVHTQAQPALQRALCALTAQPAALRKRAVAALLRRFQAFAADPPLPPPAPPPTPSAALLGSTGIRNPATSPHNTSSSSSRVVASSGAGGPSFGAASSSASAGVVHVGGAAASATGQPAGLKQAAPLYRTMLNVQAVHGSVAAGGVTPHSMLKCAAALHLASNWWSGPVGPRSMSADQLALALAEENLGWADWCRGRGLEHLAPSEQVRALLEGEVGFCTLPSPLDPAVLALQLEVYDLEKAASKQLQQARLSACSAAAAAALPLQPALPPPPVNTAFAMPPSGAPEQQQLLLRLVAQAVPGADDLSQLQRCMLRLLITHGQQQHPANSSGAPGVLSLAGCDLGQAMVREDRERYCNAQPLPSPSEGTRLAQLSHELRRCVARAPLPPTDSLYMLQPEKLAAWAALQPASMARPAARGAGAAGVAAAAGRGAEQLQALAERLYPLHEPHRAAKLATVLILGQRAAARGDVEWPHRVDGPCLGLELRKRMGPSGEGPDWPSIKAMLSGDAYLRCNTLHHSGLSVSLDVPAMLRDALARGIPLPPASLASTHLALPQARAATAWAPESGGSAPAANSSGHVVAAVAGVAAGSKGAVGTPAADANSETAAVLPPRACELRDMAAALLAAEPLPSGGAAEVLHRATHACKVKAVALLTARGKWTGAGTATAAAVAAVAPCSDEVYALIGPEVGSAVKKAMGWQWSLLAKPRLRALADPRLGLSVTSALFKAPGLMLSACVLEQAYWAAMASRAGKAPAGSESGVPSTAVPLAGAAASQRASSGREAGSAGEEEEEAGGKHDGGAPLKSTADASVQEGASEGPHPATVDVFAVAAGGGLLSPDTAAAAPPSNKRSRQQFTDTGAAVAGPRSDGAPGNEEHARVHVPAVTSEPEEDVEDMLQLMLD